MEELLIPLMFYWIVSVVYLAVAVIGFIVGYFALKVYRMVSKRSVLQLSISFFLLGIGFLVLTALSLYTYVQIQYYNSYEGIVPLNYYGFSVYYMLSIFAYLLLALMYFSDKKSGKIIPMLFVPLYYIDSFHFHVLSLLLIGFVIFMHLKNRRKSTDSRLVTFAFVCLGMFHALLLLTTFTPFMYVVANLFLIIGFLSLLTMLIRVYRK